MKTGWSILILRSVSARLRSVQRDDQVGSHQIQPLGTWPTATEGRCRLVATFVFVWCLGTEMAPSCKNVPSVYRHTSRSPRAVPVGPGRPRESSSSRAPPPRIEKSSSSRGPPPALGLRKVVVVVATPPLGLRQVVVVVLEGLPEGSCATRA